LAFIGAWPPAVKDFDAEDAALPQARVEEFFGAH